MSNQQIQKVKVKRLAHVGLWSTDVPTQARFYHQIVGLDLRTTATSQDSDLEGTNVFLTLGDEYHCLGLFFDTRATVASGRKPAVQRTSLHHLSFTVSTDAELAALAARLQISGIELSLEARDGDANLGDTLWFNDPDGNRVEIAVASDSLLTPPPMRKVRQGGLRPALLQHVALNTPRLEEMVEFYTEALGFDVSDWLLRECVWLRCNSQHHALMFKQGNPGIDHIAYAIVDGSELLHWADDLSYQEVPLLWGPGRHGAGDDLFLRFADPEGVHIELSAGLQQYHDRDVTTPPRLWHTRSMAFNLWGAMPPWLQEEA
ncbi:MAG: hypothetical protein E6J34_22345 [Chloroflexi bacterium]|nr:MAG: hypothetical protein E6J34_22345 [Chloroflexota bacterium]